MIVTTEKCQLIVVKANDNGWTNLEVLGDNSTFSTSFNENADLQNKAIKMRGKTVQLVMEVLPKKEGFYFRVKDIVPVS